MRAKLAILVASSLSLTGCSSQAKYDDADLFQTLAFEKLSKNCASLDGYSSVVKSGPTKETNPMYGAAITEVLTVMANGHAFNVSVQIEYDSLGKVVSWWNVDAGRSAVDYWGCTKGQFRSDLGD